VIDALGNNTLMTYDLVGNVKTMTDANGRITTNTYDSLNRKTQTTTPVTLSDLVNNAPITNNLTTEYTYDKNGNIISIKDPNGRITNNTYDELNRQTAGTNAFGTSDEATTKYGYDGVGNLTAVTDANNHHTTYYEYDAVNRQKKVTDALGKVTSQKTYDAAGRVISSTNMYGEITTSTYNDVTHQMTMSNTLGASIQKTDAFGNIIESKDAVGRINTYKYDQLNRRIYSKDYRGGETFDSYDGFNNLIARQDASNNVTKFEYDALNRRTNTKDSIGQISRVEYDNVGNKIDEYLTVNDGDVRHNKYAYDQLNRQYSMTTAVGTSAAATMQTGYDKVGNVVGTLDALGRVTLSTYDNLNRQTAITQAFGTIDATTSSYKYDKVGNRLEETNGRGYTTKYEYDQLNRQTKVIDAYLNETETEYFEANSVLDPVGTVLAELSLTSANVGKVIKTSDAAPFHNATYVLYDKFDRQIATYDATKHRTSASLYDAVDRVISATDTFGQNTTYIYQDALRKKVTVDALGLTTTETTDAAGNLTEVIDSIHPATAYQYDKRNRQTRITDAEDGVTEYDYYLDNQTLSVTDAAAIPNKTKYFYDRAGRLIREESPLGIRLYQYDKVDNRTQGTDRNGRITRYDYDNLDRVKSEQWVSGGKTFTYAYDENSNLTSAYDGNIRYEYAYDNTDLLEKVDRTSGTNPKVTFKYTYDEIGNLTLAEELIANNLQATTTYEYADPRYLNTKITQTGIGLANKQVKFTYDATGLNRKVERYVDGLLKVTTTNAFDTYGRLTGIEQRNGSGAMIANDTYVLDDLNRLQAQTKDGAPRTIVYDNTDQVKTVTGSNSEGYTYDKNGNRTNGGYVTDTGNRLMSDGVYNYEYDPEGNRKSRTLIADNTVELYAWDYRNRLTEIVSQTSMTGTVTRTVSYEYDVDDQRVKKTVDGVVENYYIDRNQIAFVTDGSGNQTFHYLYGLNVDSVMAQDSPSGMVWALADRLGSIETLTDKDGVVVNQRNFDSFGRVLNQTNPSVSFRYGYTGRELDLESGLNYYRARYYDPQVGRFISVDPMGFGAGDTNLYRYVGNNSTNATDPSGMWVNFAIGAAIGFGLDLTFQLIENKGDLWKTDLTRLAISTAAGAIGGGIGGFLSKQGVGLAARTAITAGAEFNLGYWGKVTQNKITGNDDLFEGALLSGAIGGLSGAGGELITAGAGKFLSAIRKSPLESSAGQYILSKVETQISNQADKMSLQYSKSELNALIKKGKSIGLDDDTVADLITIGSRDAKRLNASQLSEHMDSWIQVSQRGYPHKFNDLQHFEKFKTDIRQIMENGNLPVEDLRVQGSSLRKPSAQDVDLATFVDNETFNQLLVTKFNRKGTLRGGKIDLANMSHQDLMSLAEDIMIDSAKIKSAKSNGVEYLSLYNGEARTFGNAMKNRTISSKSEIVKPLKTARKAISSQYPELNIEAISIMVKNGDLDLKPYLRI
jgi:RHS repeat-associated protein